MEYSTEQSQHDEINLGRLVRRLELSISDKSWTGLGTEAPERTWIKAHGALQKVKYARKLLKAAEAYDVDPTSTKFQEYHDMRMKLDRVEMFMKDVEKRTTPQPKRPTPILPTLPLPPPPPAVPEAPPNEEPHNSSPPIAALEGLPSELTTDSLLLAPSDDLPVAAPMPTLIPLKSSPTAAVTTGSAPRLIQNSNALQQELSDQLALMAAQLRRNAVHFSESLVKDQTVVDEAQEKLQGNFDVMQKERLRLRDHSGKSGSTTCMVMLIVIIVTVVFMLMVSVIRFM